MSAKTDKIDPSRPLKKREHEAFAAHYARSCNAAQAWVYATGGDGSHSDANGSKWLRNGSITARVEWFRAEAEKLLRESEAAIARPVVLDIAEKREFLARVVRTPIGEVDETSDLCQAMEINESGGRKYKLPDKIAAIRLDNDLAGDGSAGVSRGGAVRLDGDPDPAPHWTDVTGRADCLRIGRRNPPPRSI